MAKKKNIIKRVRTELELTQKELGKLLSINPKVISLYELGHRNPYPRTAHKIMRLLEEKTGMIVVESDFGL